MRLIKQAVAAMATLGLAMSLLAGCQSSIEEANDALAMAANEVTVMVEGVPGRVTTRTVEMNAVVRSLDRKARKVLLEDEDGARKTVQVGADVVNFDQVEVGDRVQLKYLEELVVFLKPVGEAVADGAALAAALAPEGSKPEGMIIAASEVTATVSAVDLDAHTATLVFADGSSQVVRVRDDVALREDHVGREVVMQMTAALAISVQPL